MSDSHRTREEPIRIDGPLDIRVAPVGAPFEDAKSIATCFGGVSGRRTCKVHVLYAGGSDYPISVMEGLKSEELKALNAPVVDRELLNGQALAVWLFPPGDIAYHLPTAAVHALTSDVEISAMAPSSGWVGVPPGASTVGLIAATRVIPPGQPFFAYETFRAVFKEARQEIFVVDRYGQAESLVPLLSANPVATIRLLVDRANPDLLERMRLFSQQFGVSVELRVLKPYSIHDRFILIDRRQVWHLGASLNTLKGASVVKLMDGEAGQQAQSMVEAHWTKAVVA